MYRNQATITEKHIAHTISIHSCVRSDPRSNIELAESAGNEYRILRMGTKTNEQQWTLIIWKAHMKPIVSLKRNHIHSEILYCSSLCIQIRTFFLRYSNISFWRIILSSMQRGREVSFETSKSRIFCSNQISSVIGLELHQRISKRVVKLDKDTCLDWRRSKNRRTAWNSSRHTSLLSFKPPPLPGSVFAISALWVPPFFPPWFHSCQLSLIFRPNIKLYYVHCPFPNKMLAQTANRKQKVFRFYFGMRSWLY